MGHLNAYLNESQYGPSNLHVQHPNDCSNQNEGIGNLSDLNEH